MKTILNWLIYTLAILLTAYLLPGVHVAGFVAALVLALVLGIINVFLKPLLVVLTLPLTVFSLGLFLLVINAFLIMLAALIVPGFGVANFWWALLFSLVLSIINSVLSQIAKE